jgi:hypothetical protein
MSKAKLWAEIEAAGCTESGSIPSDPTYWIFLLVKEAGNACNELSAASFDGFRSALIRIAALAIRLVRILDNTREGK